MRELNEPEVREKYQIEVKNRFAALENSDDAEDVNRNWEIIKLLAPELFFLILAHPTQ